MVDTSVRVFSAVTGLPLVQQKESPKPVGYDLPKSHYKTPNGDLFMEMPLGMGNYKFSVTDEEFYSVLSVVDAVDSLLLLSLGVRSAEQAREFAKAKSLPSLIKPYEKLSEAALECGMKPLHFVEMTTYMDGDQLASISAPDAVRTYALEKSETPGLGFYNSLSQIVLSGEARYEDIKVIGAALLGRHSDIPNLTYRLSDLARSNSPLKFDATHIRRAIERRMESGMEVEVATSILTIMSKFGGEEALKLRNPQPISDAIYSFAISNKYGIVSYFPYADDFYDHAVGLTVNFSQLMMLHDSGVSAQKAAEGFNAGFTASQIMGMNEGVETAVSSGWL